VFGYQDFVVKLFVAYIFKICVKCRKWKKSEYSFYKRQTSQQKFMYLVNKKIMYLIS
jgi:hypothetical protein